MSVATTPNNPLNRTKRRNNRWFDLPKHLWPICLQCNVICWTRRVKHKGATSIQYRYCPKCGLPCDPTEFTEGE